MKNVVNNKIKELGNLKDNKEKLLEIYSIYLGFLSMMYANYKSMEKCIIQKTLKV